MRTALASCLAAGALALGACGGGSTTDSTTSPHGAASADAKSAAAPVSRAPATRPAPPHLGAGSAASGARPVTARHGGFRTVLPTGFTVSEGGEAEIEYRAIRRTPSRLDESLIVFRNTASRDLQATVDLALTHLANEPTFLPQPQDVSAPQPTQVDGQPALFIDYRLSGRKPSERRQLFVEDGGFAYEISASASPVDFPASLAALDELLGHWRWQ